MNKMIAEIINEMNEINLKTIGAVHDFETTEKKKKPSITICVDFDGTMVIHKYPYIGEEVPGCVETLKKWIDKYNVGIILDTMRSGKQLDAAVTWCNIHEIPLYGIQADPNQKNWTDSPKAYAPLSIDDRNVGCPLVHGKSSRPYVDWKQVNKLVEPMLKDL